MIIWEPDAKALKDRVVKLAIAAFDSELKPLGFKRAGCNWLRTVDTMAHVVNIQRSNWGGRFYVNIAVLFRDLNDIPKPREYNCQVRARLQLHGVDSDYDLLEAACSYDSSIDDQPRQDILRVAMRQKGVPFLKRFETLDSAKSALENLPLELHAFVTSAVYNHYGLTRPTGEKNP